MSQSTLKFIARLYTILVSVSLPFLLALGLVALIVFAFGGMTYWYVLPVYALLWVAYLKGAKKVESFIECEAKKFA